MSVKETDRLGVMRQMDRGKLNFKQASREMGVCLRQAKRIRKRYVAQGAQGLTSCRRGKPSNRKSPDSMRQTVIDLLKTTYAGFGPTFAAEKLKERHGLILSDDEEVDDTGRAMAL